MLIIGMMPVVKSRSRDEPLEWSESDPHIGVDEEAPDRPQDGHRSHSGIEVVTFILR